MPCRALLRVPSTCGPSDAAGRVSKLHPRRRLSKKLHLASGSASKRVIRLLPFARPKSTSGRSRRQNSLTLSRTENVIARLLARLVGRLHLLGRRSAARVRYAGMSSAAFWQEKRANANYLPDRLYRSLDTPAYTGINVIAAERPKPKLRKARSSRGTGDTIHEA